MSHYIKNASKNLISKPFSKDSTHWLTESVITFVKEAKAKKPTRFPQTIQTWRKALDSAGKHLLSEQTPIHLTRERSNIILGYISVSFPLVCLVHPLMQEINDTFSICLFHIKIQTYKIYIYMPFSYKNIKRNHYWEKRTHCNLSVF